MDGLNETQADVEESILKQIRCAGTGCNDCIGALMAHPRAQKTILGIIRRFRWSLRYLQREDIFSMCAIALWQAARTFDPAKNPNFWAYFWAQAKAYVSNWLRDHWHMVKITRRDYFDRNRRAMEYVSLDGLTQRMIGTLDGDYVDSFYDHRFGECDARYAEVEKVLDAHIAINYAMKMLTPRERFILWRYIVDGVTQDVIAGELGISQMQVSRLQRRAIARAQAAINAAHLMD